MVLVLGAGKMGVAIAHDLRQHGVETRICDMREVDVPHFFLMDVRDEGTLIKEMKKEEVVVSSLPYDFNHRLATLAIQTGTSFIDLGGNSEIVSRELTLHGDAKKKGITIIPDCGLAPGMTNIIAHHLWENGADEIHIRVGGLPQAPKPPLQYALFFSIHGLINEYLEDSIIIKNGKRREEESLTGLEMLTFEGFPELEAFYTHGGTSTLPETLTGIRELDYKTIRYRGHAEKIMLLKQLGFFDAEVREFTERVLEEALPKRVKDVVLARVYSSEGVIEMMDYYDERDNFSAMARTTGFPTSIIALMILNGDIEAGAYPPELAVDYHVFIDELKKRGIHWDEK